MSKSIDRERHERDLDIEVQWFFERWTPDDPQDAAAFQAHFHRVTRAIYNEMQRPVTDSLIAVMNAAPWPQFIDKEKE